MVADTELPTVYSVQKYESGPPVAKSPDGQLVSADGDTLAQTKQEEWVTKRRTELTTTKQIETRVKRQVVLEDGKVVDDSGPIVTTSTTEDTDKKESEHTEHLTQGEDGELGEGWVAIEQLPEEAIVKETNERKITTHDEVEDVLETEQVQHLGDVSNEAIVKAVRAGSDIRRELATQNNNRRELIPFGEDIPKRVLNQSRKHDRTTDIVDTNEVSRRKENGNLVTEITRRHEHEEFHNEDIPDSDSDEFEHLENRQGIQDYSHNHNDDRIEYLTYPKGPGTKGVKVADGHHIVTENISAERTGEDDLWESVSERIRKLYKSDPIFQVNFNSTPTNRSDVITNRPLDVNSEESTRKSETDRWLSSHFGSSTSSLSSEVSSKSPVRLSPPSGIQVTMTSRTSPLRSIPTPPPPPPPPPMPPVTGILAGQNGIKKTGTGTFKTEIKKHVSGDGKRITFSDSPLKSSPKSNDLQADLKNRHEDVMRSLNSHLGRASVSKSGNSWDGNEPTPTPPPRSRRRNSPDVRFANSPDHTSNVRGTMNYNSPRKYNTDFPSSLLTTDNDVGERKSYQRRDKTFGYTGPAGQPSFESLESGRNSGYVTKHSNYYKTDETDNPAQNSLYETGDAEVTQRKTVERRTKNFTYEGPSQKQFNPKYILGTPSSTIHRLKGIENNPEDDPDSLMPRSSTLPKGRFYFGDNQGSLTHKSPDRRSETPEYNRGKELRFGTDDINVSISNSYNNQATDRRSSSLNRSMSFTPRSVGKPSYPPQNHSSNLERDYKSNSIYKSNPNMQEGEALQAPRLISSMSRSTRDMSNDSYNNRYGQDNQETYRQETVSNSTRTKKSVLDNVRKSSPEYDPYSSWGSKASSPSRSMTPSYGGSPVRTFSNDTRVARPQNYRSLGGASSPTSDDYSETYRMSSSTPDQFDHSKPKISTDTTSRFSRRTLRGLDGQPAGKVESSETTTRTKSRYKESEIMYPNGVRRVGSPASFREDSQPKLTSGGSVIIPVKDTNNNKNSLYK